MLILVAELSHHNTTRIDSESSTPQTRLRPFFFSSLISRQISTNHFCSLSIFSMKASCGVSAFSLFLFLCILSAHSVSFSPIDNHLVDCGSSADSIVDNRRFVSDSCSTNSPLLSSARSFSLRNEDPAAGSPELYHSARVFTKPSQYDFTIRDQGTHMVRLHFHQFTSSEFDLGDAQFHVLVDGYVVLSNFSGGDSVSPRVIEYLVRVESQSLLIRFMPTKKTSFAFVNAIEVISAPKDLLLDTAQLVTSNSVERFDGLSKQALEIVYRINVGGPKVTPFNDSLWRTWVPDDEFLVSGDGSRKLYFSSPIEYLVGGASREVGPDNMYDTARLISSSNDSIANVNITWAFPVIGGYQYLVRMHFCDIASMSLGMLYFNVYVNGYLAYKDLDLTYATNRLASPFYADFVINGDSSGVLNVSVGPSGMSLPHAIDAILNGVEIMKMNNSMGSLDGLMSAECILRSWPRGGVSLWVPLVAIVLVSLSVLVATYRKKIQQRDYVGWSKLPIDVSEINMKSLSQLAGKQ